MKRVVVISCTSFLSLFLIGCSFFTGEKISKESENQKNALSTDFIWTQDILEGYLTRESDFEMSYAGPFYFGNFNGIDSYSQNYSNLRKQKIDEIILEIDAGVNLLNQLDQKLKEEKEIFTWYIMEIQNIDESTNSYTEQVLNATNLSALSSTLSDLMVLSNQAKNIPLSSVWGYLQFQRYGALVELINLYTAETVSTKARMANLYYLLEADANTAYQDLNLNFIAKIDPLSEESSELINELYHNVAVINYGDKLIFSADYYFIKNVLPLVDKQISSAKQSLADYNNSNELINEQILDLLKTKLNDLEDYKNQIVSYLEAIPKEALLPINEKVAVNQSILFPIAYASVGSPDWFQRKISDAVRLVKNTKDLSAAAVRVTGRAVKDFYDKSGAHEVVKDGAQIFNGGLEIINSGVEVSIYGIQGIYFGDTDWKDFKRRIEEEKNELHEKFIRGALGKEQYNEMIHQVNKFQKNTGRFIDNMSNFAGDMTWIVSGQPKVGDFVRNVSRNVGNEAKKVLDTATNFTKNFAIIMHPETTKEETRQAMLGIYKALQGVKNEDGTYKKIKLPDLIELTKKEAIKELGLSPEEEEEFIDQLKDMFKDELKGAESKDENKKDDKVRDDVIGNILANPNLTDEQIRDLIIKEIMRDLPPLKYKEKDEETEKDEDKDDVLDHLDNCPDIYNPDQMDTDKDGIGDACDPDCSGDIDNDGICNELDNCPQDHNPNQSDVDNDLIGDICDEDPPLISEIAGSWPGTIKVTEVYISDEFRKQAEAEGCEIADVENSKDEIKPITITINPTSETGGTISISGDDLDDKQIPFTYINGQLQASQAEKDSNMNLNMYFGRSSTTGSVDLDFMNGSIKMQAEMNLEK